MIPTRQNASVQIERLGAQRQLYGTAKLILCFQIFLSAPVVVALAILVVAYPDAKGFAALYGVLVSLSDVLLFSPWQKSIREEAARIQELFDCEVLEILWNDLKAGKKPDSELVKEQADKYHKWASKMPPVSDWYGCEVGELPIHIGRIACQRSNCWWDATQRRKYAAWVLGFVIAISAVVLLLSVRNGSSIEDFVLKVLCPLFPLLLLGIRQFVDHREAATRGDKLKEYAGKVWADALAGKPEQQVTQMARGLQDEIFDHRKRSPLIFDAIYKRLQSSYESQMNHGMSFLVGEAKQKLSLNAA